MSAAAQIWKQIISKVEGPHPAGCIPSSLVNSVDDPSFSLMHQLFFPLGKPRRSSILLVSVDRDFGVTRLSEQMAVALSKASGETVAIVAPEHETGSASLKKPASAAFGIPKWQSQTSPIAERVRRIPLDLLFAETTGVGDSRRTSLDQFRGTFEYFLLAATMSDNALPALCSLCEAAVLQVTAHVTRREAALQAKEQLMRQGVNLLGIVLDQRTLPIPESIYRRL